MVMLNFEQNEYENEDEYLSAPFLVPYIQKYADVGYYYQPVKKVLDDSGSVRANYDTNIEETA